METDINYKDDHIQKVNNPTTLNTKSIFIGIICIIIFLEIIGFIGHYLILKNRLERSNQNTNLLKTQQISDNNKDPHPTNTMIVNNKVIPTVKVGLQQYINDKLGYGFSYPESDSLYQCPDIFCLSIDNITLRIDVLETYMISVKNPKPSLLSADLYCGAEGPGGSIECKNTTIEDYTNPLGFKGYKINRTKVVTGTGGGIFAGQYSDHAFVYYLPKIMKPKITDNYVAVLFSVENPSKKNLNELDSIADTFFSYSL